MEAIMFYLVLMLISSVYCKNYTESSYPADNSTKTDTPNRADELIRLTLLAIAQQENLQESVRARGKSGKPRKSKSNYGSILVVLKCYFFSSLHLHQFCQKKAFLFKLDGL